MAYLPVLAWLSLAVLRDPLQGNFLREFMARKPVFISFDFDNDRVLKDFIIGQSKNADSPFVVNDHSLKEAAPERDWEKKAAAAIERSEIVLVVGTE